MRLHSRKKIHFQNVSLTWLWVEDLRSSPLGFSIWLLQHFMIAASFPQSKWSRREQGRSHSVFYDPVSEATHHHFCSILVAQVSPIRCGRRIPEIMNTNRWGSLAQSWRLPPSMGSDMVYGRVHGIWASFWVQMLAWPLKYYLPKIKSY